MSTLLTLFLALAAIVFSVANRDAVVLSLYPLAYEMELPKCLLMLGALAIGAVLGAMVMNLQLFRLRRALKAQTRRAEALQSELDSKTTLSPAALLPHA